MREVVPEQSNTTKTTEEIVREYFADIPVMAEVSYCESRFRQFNPNGSVLRGRVNSYDVGVMQINEMYHGAKAKQLGLDIHTLEGNLDFARHLYDTFGTDPWVHSSPCWNTVREVALLK